MVAQPTGTAMVTPGGQAGALDALQVAGFEGLNIGFGSFPIVSLKNEGMFQSTEGWELGQAFDCILMGSKEKFIVKNGQAEPNDAFFYTYDKMYQVSGKPCADTINEWRAKGWVEQWSPYLDVAVQLVGGDHDSELVILSIPKASINKYSGYTTGLWMKDKLLPTQVLTRCYRGDKVTRVKFPFYPWNFTKMQTLPQ